MSSFWYEGEESIGAIQLASDLNLPLMVFAADESVTSSNFDKVFASGATDHVVNGNFVALKVVKGSENLESVASIVQIDQIPSVSIFLNRELRGRTDTCDPENGNKLADELASALTMIKRIDSGEDIQSIQDSLDPSSSNTLNLKPLTDEEKAQKEAALKARLNELRESRKVKESEKSKADEAHRREQGRIITEAKKAAQEKEAKQILDQKLKEKREDQEARRRVKQQIEQDKLERAARKKKMEAQATEVVETPAPVRESAPKAVATVCKLGLRFPDNSVHRLEFLPSQQLGEVRQHVNDYFQQSVGGNINFHLAQAFPPKTYAAQDDTKSLLELGLCPSSSLIVKVINK